MVTIIIPIKEQNVDILFNIWKSKQAEQQYTHVLHYTSIFLKIHPVLT